MTPTEETAKLAVDILADINEARYTELNRPGAPEVQDGLREIIAKRLAAAFAERDEELKRLREENEILGGYVTACRAPKTIAEIKVAAMRLAMLRHDDDKAKVARELGISLKTVYNTIASPEYGIALQPKEPNNETR